MSTKQTLSGFPEGQLNNGADRYSGAFQGRQYGIGASDYAAYSATNFPTGGTISKFNVKVTAAPGDGKSWTFTLYKNGSPTDLTVTISGSATSASDTAHSVSVSLYDYMTMKMSPSGTPAACYAYWAVEFEPTTSGEFVLFGHCAGSQLGNNYYLFVGGENPASSETNTYWMAPCAGTVKSLALIVQTAPGASTYTLTARKGGADQTLVASFTGASTYHGQDTAHSFSVAEGDLLSFRVNAGALNRAAMAFVFVPDTEANIPYSYTSKAALDESGTCSCNGTGQEDTHQTIVLQDQILTKIIVDFVTAPGSGKDRTLTLQQNESNTELSVTISGTSTSGSDTGNVSISAGDTIRWQWSSVSTGTASYARLAIVGTASAAAAPYDDGTPSGGIVFGGEVVEVGVSNYTDGATVGGIVMGGPSTAETEPDEIHMVDGSCAGGIVFGGEVEERWYNPWAVAVKGGTYRIGGTLYTLAESMSYPGLGSIAALVNVGTPPATANRYRYDLLSIDAAGTITVTAGTEAATPVMPTLPSNEVRLDHVLRYYGQTSIIQADIGKMYSAPQLTTLTAAVTDDELSWAETDTNITITCRDQYGQLYTGGKVVNASITTGNGTISPASRSGSASSFAFTYTRDQEVTDVSPVITFSSPTGPFCTAFIRLLDSDGDLMT